MSKAGVLLPQLTSNIKYDTWVKVYDYTVTGSAVTSLSITGLNGDTAKEFKLEARIVNGYNGAANYGVRPNNDSGLNYGYQILYNSNATTPAAVRGTSALIYLNNGGGSSALGDVFQTSAVIQAKSGYVRTAIIESTDKIVTTTVNFASLAGFSWNNTADNITSLVCLADQTGGLGVGSQITLWSRNHR